MKMVVVGAGGKTTIGRKIAYELNCKGCQALFTTTTKIYRPEDGHVFIGPAPCVPADAFFMTAAKAVLENGKLKGYSPREIEQIPTVFEHIIVEADGANRKPVKAPNETEPIYPLHTSLVIGVIGLDCIGKPINDQYVHRAALFADVTQAKIGDIITARHLSRLFRHPHGLFRGAPPEAVKIVFLNKYDTINDENRDEASSVAENSLLPVFMTSRVSDWFSEFFANYIEGSI